MESLVYIISTPSYEKKNIYKIGYTTNLDQRLKEFNTTRLEDDEFQIYKTYSIKPSYHQLETLIHKQFNINRIKNELFQIKDLNEIDNYVSSLEDEIISNIMKRYN